MSDSMTDRYDVLIIGSGQAGNPLASAFVNAGRRTALIERALVAGTCINYGCTPTKTMIASAQRAYVARHASEVGIETGPVRVDLPAIRARKRRIVDEFRTSSEKRFASGTPELIRGEASFVSPHELLVRLNAGGERHLSAEIIVIDTGSSPTVPALDGLDRVPWLDNVSLMELDAVPEHLLVLGGGYEAVEFGQMFRRFGSKVTLIERGPHLLGHEDQDTSSALEEILRAEGVVIETGAKASSVRHASDGPMVTLEDGRELRGSHLLVCVGRTPNTAALHLDAAGLKTDKRGAIPVDDQLRTSVPGIYAVGDVNGGPAFTHIAYDDYRILRDNLIEGKGTRRTTDRPTVYVVYSDPQLGRIGMTEAEARRSGRPIRVARMPVSSIARAIETGDTRGMLKAIVDSETGKILGAAVLAPEGGEIMSMLQVAMMGGMPYPALENAVFAHPAYAEVLNTLWGHLDHE